MAMWQLADKWEMYFRCKADLSLMGKFFFHHYQNIMAPMNNNKKSTNGRFGEIEEIPSILIYSY